MKSFLFIDFDGTLCFDRFWQNLPHAEASAVQEFLFTKKNPIVHEWMCGRLSSEEVASLAATATGIPADTLFEKLREGRAAMIVSSLALELILSLRPQYEVVLSTDNMDSFSRFTIPALGLTKYFDRILNSADLGRMKADENGRMFSDIAGAAIADAHLLDNSPRTIQTFVALGGTEHLVTPREPVTYWLGQLAPSGATRATSFFWDGSCQEKLNGSNPTV